MISYRISCLTPSLQSTIPSDSIQHQRSAIRRSPVLTVKSASIQFHELSSSNFHQLKSKRDLERQSPILIRRVRPSIEHFLPHQQPSDIQDVHGNQLHVIRSPPQLLSRTRSPRISSSQSKPLKYSKTMPENINKHIGKFSQSLQTPIWSPILIKKEIIPSRALRSKSSLSKHTNTHVHHQIHNEKKFLMPDLFISSKSHNHQEEEEEEEIFKKTTIKDLVDEWEDPKSNVAVSADDDDSIITNCNDPILTIHSRHTDTISDPFASSIFIPYSTHSYSQRRPLSFYLPAVEEDSNDEND